MRIRQTTLHAVCKLCTLLNSLLHHEAAVQTLRVFELLVGDVASCCDILVPEQAPTQLLLLQQIIQPCGVSCG